MESSASNNVNNVIDTDIDTGASLRAEETSSSWKGEGEGETSTLKTYTSDGDNHDEDDDDDDDEDDEIIVAKNKSSRRRSQGSLLNNHSERSLMNHHSSERSRSGSSISASSYRRIDAAGGVISSSSSVRISSSSSSSREMKARESSLLLEQQLIQITPLSPTAVKQKAEKLASFGAKRLNFDTIGLVGREEEIAILENALARVVSSATSKRNKEAIFISGNSGTGKTALAETLRNKVENKRFKGAFVSAKYDVGFRDSQPFSGIGTACNELCRKLLDKATPAELKEIKAQLQQFIDPSQISIIETVVPLLSNLVTSSSSSSSSGASVEHQSELLSTPQQPQPQQNNNNNTKPEGSTPPPNRGNTKRRSMFQRKENKPTNTEASEDFLEVLEPNKAARSNNNKGRRTSIFTRKTTTHHDDAITRRSHHHQQQHHQDKNNNRPANSSSSTSNPMDPKAAKEVLNMALRYLIRILMTAFPVMIMLLDDLQWADSPSMELLQSLIKDDDEINNLIVIGCFRSEEVDDAHVSSKVVRTLKEEWKEEEDCNYTVTELTVGNLSLEATNKYVQELLWISDPAATKGLAHICHRRTMGNVFFLQVFLLSLYDTKLLEFNTGSFQWRWDESRVESETAATDNLIGLLRTKMNRCSQDVLILLKTASCLGNTFEKSTLKLLWRYGSKLDKDFTGGNLDSLLQDTVDEMFLEIVNETSYRFVHDKVQEASSSLIEEDKSNEFHNEIGNCLYHELDDEELDRMLFVVVDLLNKRDKDEASIELALLNLQAAERSIMLSAFLSASIYVEHGIKLLGCSDNNNKDAMWKNHAQIALRFHNIGAQAESCIGRSDISEAYCSEVIKQSSLTIFDKLDVYRVWIDHQSRTDDIAKGWAICLDVFEALGYDFPKNPALLKLRAMKYLRDTKKKYLPSPEEVKSLPIASDPNLERQLSLLASALGIAVATKQTEHYILLCCKSLRLTKKGGLTEYTGSMFASFANVLMHKNGDWSTAVKMAETGLAIQSRVKSNYTKCSTLQKANNFVLGWVKPLKSIWADQMEGYRLAMLSGNLHCSAICIMASMWCLLFSGSSLQSINSDCEIYVAQLESCKLWRYSKLNRIVWQCVLNLIGGDPQNPNTTVLHGSAWGEAGNNEQTITLILAWFSCYICMYFGEYQRGADIAMEIQDNVYKRLLGLGVFGFDGVPQALCLFAASRASKSRKGLVEARKHRNTIKYRVKQGGMNLLHHLQLLDAEDAAVRKNDKAAQSNYRQAITTASRSGFVHDAGLANERYASYLLSLDEVSDALYYYKEALRCYSEWGADRKVELLKLHIQGVSNN